MTWYVLDKNEYMAAAKQNGVAFARLWPALSRHDRVEVSGLLEANARVEIEVTAVVPD